MTDGPWPAGAESEPVNTLAFLTGTLLGTTTRLFRADVAVPHVDREGRRVSTLILMESGTRVALTLELVGDDEEPPAAPRATERPTEQKWQEADPDDLAEPGWTQAVVDEGTGKITARRRRKTTAAEQVTAPPPEPVSAAVPADPDPEATPPLPAGDERADEAEGSGF